MQRMLESHMDDETMALVLEKIEEIERSGLAYRQHGVDYKNPHYDMSFALKKLTLDEFHQLQAILGENSTKIKQATADNYQTIPFTATEYETLKNELKKHTPWHIDTSPATALSDKLEFDFHSLITALKTYVTNYDEWGRLEEEKQMALLAVGKAQRDVPAHIAHEYCCPSRSFYPRPEFNEETLPRGRLTFFYDYNVKHDWFPLESSSSGLGHNFAVYRGYNRCAFAERHSPEDIGPALEAVSHLDRVRTADLTQSRKNLASPTMLDIEPEALLDKLGDVQWHRLSKKIVGICNALPAFRVRPLLEDVAKGKQDEANTLLQASHEAQTLLRACGRLTDYSGRQFNCTAYEYAYWAKDTHMRRMLENHMDDETKAFLLEKINEIERSGLAYRQHGVDYKNPHYDMSFVLKKLTLDEFHQLQTMVGEKSTKIQQATADNYQTIAFTATEYEVLKYELKKHQQYYVTSFFYTLPANAIADKLQFDFHSLITALATYKINRDRYKNYYHSGQEWFAVGKAQRDVPAHIAQEYCRPDRSFCPRPEFNEETLPRVLTFDYDHQEVPWFPLGAPSRGLGFMYALYRDNERDSAKGQDKYARWCCSFNSKFADLAAVRHLDEVRTAELTQSRENLAAPNHGLRP